MGEGPGAGPMCMADVAQGHARAREDDLERRSSPLCSRGGRKKRRGRPGGLPVVVEGAGGGWAGARRVEAAPGRVRQLPHPPVAAAPDGSFPDGAPGQMTRAAVSGGPGRRKKVGEVGQNMGEELAGKGMGEDGRRRRHPSGHPW
jgi:hypothetical protein